MIVSAAEIRFVHRASHHSEPPTIQSTGLATYTVVLCVVCACLVSCADVAKSDYQEFAVRRPTYSVRVGEVQRETPHKPLNYSEYLFSRLSTEPLAHQHMVPS